MPAQATTAVAAVRYAPAVVGQGRLTGPTGLTTDSLPAPMDIDQLTSVNFGWQSEVDKQTAYGILASALFRF